MDIHAHGGDPETALVITRDWLTNVSRRQLLGEKRFLSVFRQFRGDLPALAEKLEGVVLSAFGSVASARLLPRSLRANRWAVALRGKGSTGRSRCGMLLPERDHADESGEYGPSARETQPR